MTNKTQIQTKKISFVLTLSVITYATVDTYLFIQHDINIMPIATPVIIGIVISILLCGLLHRFFYVWLTKNQIQLSFGRQFSPVTELDNTVKVICTDETQSAKQPKDSLADYFSSPHQLNQGSLDSDCREDSHLDNYDTILEDLKKKEIERQEKIMIAIREYVTIKTAPYLSKEALATLIRNIEYMACNQPDLYKPLRSNINNPLKSPGLRHLAWNVGERLNVSLAKRAAFIKASFPHELENATHEYLKLNLRDNISSQIPIDVPDKGNYRFHLDTDNNDSQ